MTGRVVGYVVVTPQHGRLDLRWDGELYATEDEAQVSADEARSAGWPAAVGIVTAPELTEAVG